MEKVKIDKLECRFPTLFKVMWTLILGWLLASMLNCIVPWVAWYKLDGFGANVIFLFVVCLMVCFGKPMKKLIEMHSDMASCKRTGRVAMYVKMLMMFSGRLRRIGTEGAAAIIVIVCLMPYYLNTWWLDIIIVLIAVAFLFDIWCFADFKKEEQL